MGLNIALIDSKGDTIVKMNWLRNPFGLVNWIQDNCARQNKELLSLHYVCNEWSYDNAVNVDRKLFLDVVLSYVESLDALQRGYHYFDLRSYRLFIEPVAHKMKKNDLTIEGSEYVDITPGDPSLRDNPSLRGDRIRIPVENCSVASGIACLDYYKKWYKQLVDFAELLQDPTVKFWCEG